MQYYNYDVYWALCSNSLCHVSSSKKRELALHLGGRERVSSVDFYGAVTIEHLNTDELLLNKTI